MSWSCSLQLIELCQSRPIYSARATGGQLALLVAGRRLDCWRHAGLLCYRRSAHSSGQLALLVAGRRLDWLAPLYWHHSTLSLCLGRASVLSAFGARLPSLPPPPVEQSGASQRLDVWNCIRQTHAIVLLAAAIVSAKCSWPVSYIKPSIPMLKSVV